MTYCCPQCTFKTESIWRICIHQAILEHRNTSRNKDHGVEK